MEFLTHRVSMACLQTPTMWLATLHCIVQKTFGNIMEAGQLFDNFKSP
ncbi:hypothetical protein Lser_V15G36953 [Lactuca serriola]